MIHLVVFAAGRYVVSLCLGGISRFLDGINELLDKLFYTGLRILRMYVVVHRAITIAVVGGVAIGGVASLYLLKRYTAGGVCRSKALLDGKTVIITGANRGIGKETAVDLARRNARVVLVDVEGGDETVWDVRNRSRNDNIIFHQLDLASLASVRQFAAKILEEEPHIDVLVNNAGIRKSDYGKSEDGIELNLAVNYLGHFLLTNLLLERMKEAPAARIVNLSSYIYTMGSIHFEDLNLERCYDRFGLRAYSQSKLAVLVFTRSLAKRLEGTNVTANAVNPGNVRTQLSKCSDIFKYFTWPIYGMIWWMFFKTAQQGAQTSIYCAVSEEMEGLSGQYLSDCRVTKPSKAATDDEVAERLWQVSAQMVGLETTDSS